jgi:hypothetical protein
MLASILVLCKIYLTYPTTDWPIWRPGFDIRQRKRIFSFIFCVQTSSETHSASYPVGTVCPFPGGKSRQWRDADHLPHPMPRSGMSRSKSPLPLVACMVVAGQLYFTSPADEASRKPWCPCSPGSNLVFLVTRFHYTLDCFLSIPHQYLKISMNSKLEFHVWLTFKCCAVCGPILVIVLTCACGPVMLFFGTCKRQINV